MHQDPPLALPPVIDAAGLSDVPVAHRRLVDVRWSPDGTQGHTSYLDGHLPGAVFLDLDRDLAAAPCTDGGRHPLPSPEAFAVSLGRVGIGPEHAVVAYDQGHGAFAARLVWMCRAIGQPATLLSGGLAGWDGPLERGEIEVTPVDRAPLAWPASRLAQADELAAPTRGMLVLDARDPARYRGEHEPLDPRPGHIPGAVNLPFAANLDDDGRVLPVPALEERYREVGALDADDVVVYCGSGVTACHDLLMLESLGVSARLYPGSWSSWSADPTRPAALGPQPAAP